jgi:hypothetical protein
LGSTHGSLGCEASVVEAGYNEVPLVL